MLPFKSRSAPNSRAANFIRFIIEVAGDEEVFMGRMMGRNCNRTNSTTRSFFKPSANRSTISQRPSIERGVNGLKWHGDDTAATCRVVDRRIRSGVVFFTRNHCHRRTCMDCGARHPPSFKFLPVGINAAQLFVVLASDREPLTLLPKLDCPHLTSKEGGNFFP